MRIERISLRNYRGVRASTVSFAATGVTIVEGDNEVGKSSLAEALRLIVKARDDSKRADVRAVQPVHRDCGPEVEVVLTTGPYRLEYAKRWLRKHQTTLTVLEPAREQLAGREAHERVEAILAETLDSQLWDALSLEQGTDAAVDGFDVPSLGRALDLAAGEDLSDDSDDALWDRIVAEKDRFWTPTWKSGKDRVSLEARVQAATARTSEIQAELRDLAAKTDEMARLEAESRELADGLARHQGDLETYEEQVRSIEGLRREVQDKSGIRATAVSERIRWDQTAVVRADLADRVVELAREVSSAEALLTSSAPSVADLEARRQETSTRRERAARALTEVEDAHARATEDADHRRREIELAQLCERRGRVVDSERERERAEALIEESSIDDAGVAAIEDAHLEVTRAEAAAEAGATSVTALAATALVVEVDGEPVDLGAGVDVELAVGTSSRIVVPDLVTLTLRPGQDQTNRDRRLVEARARLESLCQTHHVVDLADARLKSQARRDAERTRLDAGERIKADLRDLTLDEIVRKIERISERLVRYVDERPSDPTLPPDHETAQRILASTHQALAAKREELARLDEQVALIEGECTEARVENVKLVEAVEFRRRAHAAARQALTEARALTSDEEIEARLEAAVVAERSASAALVEAEAQLSAKDPATLDDLLSNARAALARAQTATRDNHDRRQRLGSLLEDRGEQGLAQGLDAATTELTRLRAEQERLESRAVAAKLLHDVFAERRAQARKRYQAPFREAIERLGRVVFGPDLAIELDSDLRIATRTLDGVTVGFDHLSSGAREQLGLLSRLACASIVSEQSGAPVMIDDALGWSDPQRLTKMAAAIAVAARDCQVIILTCTPGRFASIGDAKVIRLDGDNNDADHSTSLTA